MPIWAPTALLASTTLAGPTATYVSTNNTTATTTTYTFTAQNIGAASSDRVVVVGVGSGMTGTASTSVSMTIGGVAATQLRYRQLTPGNGTTTALFALNVPAGTTATIVVTYSVTQVRCGIVVWSLTGTSGVTTPLATGDNGTTFTSPASLSISTSSGGAVIAFAADGNSGSSATIGWTGTTSDVNSFMAGSCPFSGSHKNATNGSSLSISASETSPACLVLIVASW